MTPLKRSENLFRDLLKSPDHEALKAKHEAAAFVRGYMLSHGLAQAELAERCGLTQPQVSQIVNFKLRNFSIDRLNDVLAKIDDSARIETQPVFRAS